MARFTTLTRCPKQAIREHHTNKKQCSRQLQCEVPCIGNVINSSLFINSSLSSLSSTSHAACWPQGGGCLRGSTSSRGVWPGESGGLVRGSWGLVGGGGRGHFSPAAIYCITTWCFALKGLRTMRVRHQCENRHLPPPAVARRRDPGPGGVKLLTIESVDRSRSLSAQPARGGSPIFLCRLHCTLSSPIDSGFNENVQLEAVGGKCGLWIALGARHVFMSQGACAEITAGASYTLRASRVGAAGSRRCCKG